MNREKLRRKLLDYRTAFGYSEWEIRKDILRAFDSLTKERDEARGWLEKISQPRLRRGLGDIRILKEIGYDYSAQVLEAVDDYLSSQGTFIPL